MATDAGLGEHEIMSLVHDYIGVGTNGYLWGFSYRTHEDFHPRYCNVRIDVARRRQEHGSTRATFLAILRGAAPALQAKIVEGTFEYLPDADVLIREQGNTSGVDRVHTALHGYLRALCAKHGVTADENADAARLLKLLRTHVPALRPGAAREEDVARIRGALGTIVDALNPVRNQASLAHPNAASLDVPEAALAIDAARSVLNYVNRKLT